MDVLVCSGGQGTRRQLRDHVQLDWVRRQRADVPELHSSGSGCPVAVTRVNATGYQA